MVHEEEIEPQAPLSEKSKKINKVLDIYKQLSQNPNLIDARIISIARNGINIQSFWQQKNLERVIKQRFTQEFGLDADLQMVCESFPIDVSTEALCIQTENEKLKAILREVPDRTTCDGNIKQYIEIWDRQHLIKSYDLQLYDIHGPVYTDPKFASFQWSPGNSHIIYLAKKKPPKHEPFYKQRSHKQKLDPEIVRGEENFFVPDFGESYVGVTNSVIIILNTHDDTIRTQDFLPPNYFPAQVMWTPNGDYIVGICYKTGRRNLGLWGCTNRESNVFLLKNTTFKKLTPDGRHCTAPQFSPDGKHLIWLEREIGPANRQCHKLMRVMWDTDEKSDILIDYVQTSIPTKNGKQFYGFYNETIPRRCWTHDSKFLFVSTPQRSDIKSYLVNLENKDLYEIENNDDSSLEVLDVRKNRVVFLKTSFTKPPQLTVGKFEPGSKNIANLNLVNVTEPLNNAGLEKLVFEQNEFIYNTNDAIKDFNFTYFGPKNGDEHTVPLIVIPHGGPHSTISNAFNMESAILASLGFAILYINFRGSLGMGSAHVDFLQGKVGETDVFDCVTAINASLKKYKWLDPARVVLKGLCHGGFLSAHLSAQYPHMFRAVVLGNPVIDIPAMQTVTDIPDWCAASTGVPFMEKLPPAAKETKYAEIVMKMFNHSPILHSDKVRAPTLILLGSDDVRVHMGQGKLWYNRLIANNVETKLMVYKDDHSLGKEETELDRIINTALWLQRQMIDKADQEPEEEEIGGIAAVQRSAPKSPEPPPPAEEPAAEAAPEATA